MVWEMLTGIEWKMLAGPAIGAIIGYCTNWLAVKMLFRPLHPKYIGKYRLPFTPGIIPNGKQRLAKAIGNAVGNQLLTKEILESVLLSDDIKARLTDGLEGIIETSANSDTPVRALLTNFVDETDLGFSLFNLEKYISTRIEENLKNMNVGEIVAEQVSEAIKARVQGTMIAFMVTDHLLASISNQIAEAIDNYVVDNVGMVVPKIVKNEFGHILDTPVKNIVAAAKDSKIDLNKIVLSIYEKFVMEKLPGVISVINFSGIAQARIEAMDEMEVETLVMSIMKKELGAVVNLGALIGFVLGLFNLVFYG